MWKLWLYKEVATSKRANPSSFQLGPELDDEITQMAAALGIPRSQVVERTAKHYIASQKHIGAVLSGARKSLADYKTAGLGVPFSEAAQWLSQGAESEEMPDVREMRK